MGRHKQNQFLETGFEGVELIHLAQDLFQWRIFVKTVLNGFRRSGLCTVQRSRLLTEVVKVADRELSRESKPQVSAIAELRHPTQCSVFSLRNSLASCNRRSEYIHTARHTHSYYRRIRKWRLKKTT